MDKLLLFPGKTDRGIFTYVIDTERRYLEKTASEYHPTIAAYINAAKPLKGKTQLLLTALGAGEWWGDNVNGDYFPEKSLAHEGRDYGYKTFEYFAKIYKHHVNKDPQAAYGDIALSVYNPIFHRVELIVILDNERAPDIASRVNNGEYPDVSMGCKVPWDQCSICGNKAPTRAQYCDHLRYHMGRIDPETGKKVFAINVYPRFFDLSFVLIGADRIAKTLRKVASPYAHIPVLSSAYLAEKMAEKKEAEIKKEIPPDQPPASTESLEKAKDLAKTITEVKSMEPALPRRLLDSLADHPLPKVMSTMTLLGILPKPQEFQRIILIQMGHRPLADHMDRQNLCFDPMSVEEPSEDHIRSIDLGAHNFDNMLAQRLMPFMADRSYAAPHLGRRIVIMIKKGEEQPLPTFIKVSAEDTERKPLSPVLALLAAAGAYAALTRLAPKGTLEGIHKVLSSDVGMGVAAALGLGLIKSFNRVAGPSLKGQYSPAGASTNPDTSDVFARIEALKQKPFNKVGSAKSDLGFSIGHAAKRLFLGVPLAYMASGVLQKHRDISPYDSEGRIRSFIRRNPDIVSAGLIADAVLSAKGHPVSTRALAHRAGKLFKRGSALELGNDSGYSRSAALADKLYGTDFSKLADAQDFLSSSVIWPLAIGKHNLPGRIVGGLFDQAVLETGSKLLEKREKAKLKKLEKELKQGTHT